MPENSTNGRQLAPAPLGNRRAVTHGAYVTKLTPLETAEVDEIAAEIRNLSPLNVDAIEPLVQLLAGQLWRRRRGYQDLERHGVVRGRADRGKVAPVWAALDMLERQILAGLEALGLSPRAAAKLGLTLARTEEATREFDPSRLSRGRDSRPSHQRRRR